MKIGVVIPVYNEADAIESNFGQIRKILDDDGVRAHYILVDDGSKDESWDAMKRIAEKYDRVRIIRFSRNFGKEMAIRAGIDNIKADRYVVMDSDLQHPPRHIKPMLDLMDEKGVDLVNGKKASRGKEGATYGLFARMFYGIMKAMSGVDMRGGSDFKVFTDKVAEQIRKFKESGGLFRGLVDWVGFSQAEYLFDVEERAAGKTSFSTKRLFKLAINSIVSHSSKPLIITVYIGVIFFVFALILAIQTLVSLFSGNSISGYTTIILLMLIIGGAILICLGLIGIYLARIYDEIKGRPRYILSETYGDEPDAQ